MSWFNPIDGDLRASRHILTVEVWFIGRLTKFQSFVSTLSVLRCDWADINRNYPQSAASCLYIIEFDLKATVNYIRSVNQVWSCISRDAWAWKRMSSERAVRQKRRDVTVVIRNPAYFSKPCAIISEKGNSGRFDMKTIVTTNIINIITVKKCA